MLGKVGLSNRSAWSLCGPCTSFFNWMTIARAKMIALSTVLVLTAYHGLLRRHYDSCEELLNSGEFRTDGTWQPEGCLIHNYTKQDLERCMGEELEQSSKNHVYFIGEHRVRSLYFRWVNEALGKDQSKKGIPPEEGNHAEDDRGLQVDFIWSPRISQDMITFIEGAKKSKGSSLFVLGAGLHYIVEANTTTSQSFQRFNDDLVKLMKVVDEVPDSVTVIWKSIEVLTSAKERAYNVDSVNTDIIKYNSHAAEMLNKSRIVTWGNIQKIMDSRATFVIDTKGTTYIPIRTNDDVLLQILFNYQCNRLVRPNDGSCCVAKETPTWTQLALLALCGLVGAWFLKVCCFQQGGGRTQQDSPGPDNISIISSNDKKDSPSGLNSNASSSTVLASIMKMALVLLYCYMCDRANFYLKENKVVSVFHFYLASAGVVALSLFSLRPSSQSAIMHRDITDEVKGWMQLIILAYHMTGSSFYLPVYMHIRLLVSFYLFLTGFGHFIYAWSGKKMTFARYCQVMFRLNFLAVMLCLVMNRTYQFYYFVVLVSFWFSVLYATLALPPLLLPPIYGSRHTPRSYVYAIMKIFTIAVVVTLLYEFKAMFDGLFQFPAWSALFQGPDGTVDEWYFRWSLDRYSVVYGSMFGLLYRWVVERGWIDDGATATLHRGRLRVLVVLLLSLVLLPSYLFLLQHCDTKQTCNEWHPFLMALPIIGYIFLRNELGYVRTTFSKAMAWCGKISLELFVCQYHIWLAQDTYGMLVLIPGYPIINMFVISFILVCVAHEIHGITNTLVGVLVPSAIKPLLRNIACFAVMLFALTTLDKYILWII